MKNRFNAKTLAGLGILTAIVIVLQFVAIWFRGLLPFALSFVLVPIVIGSALYGVLAGAWLGLVFALVVLFSGDANVFLAIKVFPTILIVVVKGVLCGVAAGLVYKLFEKKNMYLAVILAAIVCPVVNTGIFLIGCAVFFMDTISAWAAAAGFENAVPYMFLGLAGINFLIELGVNIVLSPIILRLIKLARKS